MKKKKKKKKKDKCSQKKERKATQTLAIVLGWYFYPFEVTGCVYRQKVCKITAVAIIRSEVLKGNDNTEDRKNVCLLRGRF